MRLAPTGWALVVVTSGFALLSVVVYLSTGDFSQGWLIASAVVYGLVALAAVVLAALDRPALVTVPVSVAAPAGEPVLLAREVVYASGGGEALRLTYGWPDQSVETRYVAVTSGEMLTHQEISTYVDALPPADEPAALDDVLDDALARRGAETKEETTA